MKMNLHELELKSWDLRRDVVDIIMAGGGGHIGGDMSVLNTLLVLYKNHLRITPETTADPNRDRFVLSKGHAVEALYAVLADCGFLDLNDIKARFSKFGSPYIGHPNNKLNGIEMNSGSLGHGLPVCVGMALAGKMDKKDYRVYTVMGDGELAEGSVWEGAMAASNYKLDNLCAVVDRNRLQIDGSTETVMSSEPLEEKMKAFNFNVLTINGHDYDQIEAAIKAFHAENDKPTCIIMDTTKGKGVSFMTNSVDWHGKGPNDDEYKVAMEELNAAYAALEQEEK